MIDSRGGARLPCVPTMSDHERMSRAAGLRVTRPRLAVLSVVYSQPHADADLISRVMGEEVGRVTHQAVYAVLPASTAAGLVRRSPPLGCGTRYEARVRDDHQHVVRRSCGLTTDLDGALGDTACLTAPASRATTSATPRPSTGVDAACVAATRPSG